MHLIYSIWVFRCKTCFLSIEAVEEGLAGIIDQGWIHLSTSQYAKLDWRLNPMSCWGKWQQNEEGKKTEQMHSCAAPKGQFSEWLLRAPWPTTRRQTLASLTIAFIVSLFKGGESCGGANTGTNPRHLNKSYLRGTFPLTLISLLLLVNIKPCKQIFLSFILMR